MKNEIIDDQFILNYFYSSPASTKINGQKTKNIPDGIQEYLDNRFSDAESTREVIMRIKYGPIEERPKCPICGNSVRWYGHKQGRLFHNTCCHEHEVIMRKRNIKKAVIEKYGVDNVFQLDEIKEKNKQTWINHYGVDNPRKCDEVKEKYVNTCLLKYGLSNGGGTQESIEKARKTYMENHNGIDNPMHDPAVIEKMHKICFERTGYTWFSKIPSAINKCKQTWKNKEQWEIDDIIRRRQQTCYDTYGTYSHTQNEYFKLKQQYKSLEKTGYSHYNMSPEHREKMRMINSSDVVKQKTINTKIKNNSFYRSQPEEDIYYLLRLHFGSNNIIRQYNSKEYPFNCDFYIKNINCYIEYQGTWTHGKHPFNNNDENDINILSIWESKNTKYYEEAIKTWTIRDPLKRLYAQINKLNYLEFWSINEVKSWLDKQT